MLRTSFSTYVNATPSRLWDHYINVELRKKWKIDLESLSFDGEIKTGNYGNMVLAGLPPIRFLLSNVIVNEEFTDEVNIPHLGKLTFSHKIKSKDNHSVLDVSVTLECDEYDADKEKFFLDVTADLAETALRLKHLVESE